MPDRDLRIAVSTGSFLVTMTHFHYLQYNSMTAGWDNLAYSFKGRGWQTEAWRPPAWRPPAWPLLRQYFLQRETVAVRERTPDRIKIPAMEAMLPAQLPFYPLPDTLAQG